MNRPDIFTTVTFVLLSLVACAPVTASPPESGALSVCREADLAPSPVWQGFDGWLFNKIDMIARFDPGTDVKPDLARLVRAFELQGVTLVAAVLPTRGSVYSEHLDRRNPAFADYSAAVARASYRSFLTELRSVGIYAPDLTDEVEGAKDGLDEFFFKGDQHWTSTGARRAAEAVAVLLRPLPAYQELEKTLFRTRSQGWVTQKGWLQERAESLCDTSLPDEALEIFTTEPVVSKPGVSTAEALLADPGAPPVTLVGTSNSKRFSDKPDLNFSGFLRQSLGLEVLNAAFAGSGVYGSLLPYLNSDEYLTHKPKFLVWETLIWDWHHRLRITGEHRQVIPSVSGACKPEAGFLQTRTEAGKRMSFEVLKNDAEQSLQGHDYFVYLEVEDRALVNFSLELTYVGGKRESVRLVHMTRVPNPGKFFLELSDYFSALQSAAIVAQREVAGTVRARVCRSPLALP